MINSHVVNDGLGEMWNKATMTISVHYVSIFLDEDKPRRIILNRMNNLSKKIIYFFISIPPP